MNTPAAGRPELTAIFTAFFSERWSKLARLATAATLAGPLLLQPAFAIAAPEDPVREVMMITAANWSGNAAPEDLFTQERLDRLFSTGFKALYAQAMKTGYAEQAGTPFDYDVVVNAQDGCPLEDVTIAPAVDDGEKSEITVRFQFLSCLGDTPEYQAYSETRFLLVSENGENRIDDIIATNPDGMTLSAREQLTAASGAVAE